MVGRGRKRCSNSEPRRVPWACVLCATLALFSISAEPPPDPVPIQRIQLSPDRVAHEIKRLRQRVLTKMPLEQFEALVRQAAQSKQDSKKSPELLESHYQAQLDGDGLAGSAEWKLLNSASGAARMPLAPLQLGLREANWPNQLPAIVGRLDEKADAPFELLVPKPGAQTLFLKWSARGIPEPGGLRFNLRLQPCPITILELELPADRIVRADRDSVVASGPLPSGKSNLNLWRLSISRVAGATSTVQFVVHQRSAKDSLRPIARPLIQTTQQLKPGGVECEYVLDLQVDRGGLSNFVLACDAGLRVTELEAPGLEEWEATPAPGGSLVRVRLRDSIRGGRISVRAVAPLPPADQPWISPGLHVAGGIARGEKLTLLVHPDLELQDWQPGGFRPISDSGNSESMQAIYLQSRTVGSESTARPKCRIRFARAGFDVTEALNWSIEPDRMALTAEMRVAAHRGVLSQLEWSIPPGWEVEQVDSKPDDPGLRWQMRPSRKLSIEPSRPVSPARKSDERRWVIRLRAPGPRMVDTPDGLAATLPWPDLKPDGARLRQGRLGVRVHPNLTVVATEGNPQLRSGEPVAYEGDPHGLLQVRARRARLRARVESSTIVREQSVAHAYRIELIPGVGSVGATDFFTSVPINGEWRWKTISGTSAVRRVDSSPIGQAIAALTIAAPGSIWDVLSRSYAGSLAARKWWRIAFDQPLQKTATVELSLQNATSQRIDVPLIAVLGSDRFDARADLFVLPRGGWSLESVGLRESAARLDRTLADWESHSFRYGGNPASLALRRGETKAGSFAPRVDRAAIIVSAALEGRTWYRFEAAISGWMRPELPIRLPAGIELIAARVDGCAASISPTRQVHEPAVLALPWRPSASWHFVEIVYSIAGPAWRGAKHVKLLRPEFPFAVSPRQVWRLPQGLVPLTLENWRVVPGSSRRADAPWFLRLRPSAAGVHASSLDDAIRALPPRSSESLGQWLERWGFENRDSAGLLVADSPALAEQGIGPAELADESGSFGIASKQLEFVVINNATLLTTLSRLAYWRQRIPADVTAAVESVAGQGHDESGRFMAIDRWLSTTGDRSADLDLERPTTDWTEWEPTGGSPVEQIILIESSAVSIVAIGLALLLLSVAILIGTRRRIYLLACLIIAASGLVWLPKPLWGIVTWPLAAVGMLMIVAWIRGIWSSRSSVSAVATSVHEGQGASIAVPLGLVLAAGLAIPGSAAGPEPTPVYLVATGQVSFSVLAPPELIDNLKRLAKSNQPTASAVITSAQYEGKIDDAVVRWKATLDLSCFADSTTALTIPLEGAQLRRALLDGVELLPRPGAAPGRLVFELAGRGAHSLVLEFDVMAEGQTLREARCKIPDAAIGSIAVDMPKSIRFPLAPLARGVQRIVENDSGRRLTADLGRGGELLIRWHAESTVAMPRSQVEETSMWDLSDSEARLRSVFRYRLSRSPLKELEFVVPPGLELTAATVRSLDERLIDAVPTVVADWRGIAPDRVRLSFEPELSGQVQLILDLVPRRPLGTQPVLPVPAAVGDLERQSYLAIRMQNLGGNVIEAAGWRRVPAALLFHDRWQPLRVDSSDQEPDLALQHIGETSQFPRISLQPLDLGISGNQQIDWRVGPARAELQAVGTWANVSLSRPLEWQVPANVAVSDIRGAQLRSWSRHGEVVQIWLNGPMPDAPVGLTMTGSVSFPPRKSENTPFTFELPAVSLEGVSRQTHFVRVEPFSGWKLGVEKSAGYQSAPSTDLPGAGWTAFGDVASRAVFALRPATGQVQCDCLTVAEPAGRAVAFTGLVKVRSTAQKSAGSIQTIAIDVRRAESDKLQIEIPPGTRLRDSRPTASGMTWIVDCLPGEHRILISGRLAATQSRDLSMPAIRARGLGLSPPSRRWVIVGTGLRARDPFGLRLEAAPPELLNDFVPDRVRRAAQSWAVQNDEWALHLDVGQVGTGDGGPAFVSTVDAAAAPGDAGRWLLQMRAYVFQDVDNPWSIRLPRQSQILVFSIDGQEQSLPLAPRESVTSRSLVAGLHRIRLVWQSSTPVAESPPLALPDLEFAGAGATWPSVLWTISAPPGYRAVTTAGSVGSANLELSRAAAWLELYHQVADRGANESLPSLRAAIDGALRRAEIDLASNSADSESSPDGRPLAEWLKQLRDKAPPATSEEPTVEAYSSAFLRGASIYWRSHDGDEPPVKMEESNPTSIDKWVVSGILALLLLFGGIAVRRL